MKEKNNSSSVVYFLLGGFILIFLGILIFSTLDTNIVTTVEFEDEISYGSQGEKVIGTIKFENNGYLPQRVELPNYFICNENRDNFYLYYTNSEYNSDIFGSYNIQYVEVKSKDSVEVSLVSSYYPTNYNKENNQTNATTGYIFLGENNNYNHRSCIDVDFRDAIATIAIRK